MPRSKTTATQPRGMVRIIANKSGTYTFQWFANSKLSQETYPTRPQAVARQAEVWQAKQTGNTAALDKSKGEVPFLDDCARWIERGQKRGESTKRIYRSILKAASAQAGRAFPGMGGQPPTEVEDIINAAGALYVSRARVIIVGCCKSAVIARDIPSHNLAGLDIAGDERVKPASSTRPAMPNWKASPGTCASGTGSWSGWAGTRGSASGNRWGFGVMT